jgi:antitoxin (DNA-binding transcriptional repressor) of toxin-antitoxin stability system
MTQVTIHQAKTQLSRLIQKALAGEEVVIANRDKPVVRLEVIAGAKPDRSKFFGCLKDQFSKEAVDFLTNPKLDEEIAEDFYTDNPHDPLRTSGRKK